VMGKGLAVGDVPVQKLISTESLKFRSGSMTYRLVRSRHMVAYQDEKRLSG
jgi:hypothetical protein